MKREHTDRERRIDALLVAVGLGIALLGQFYFALRREYVWDGVLFWCVALVSFGLLRWRTTRLERGRSCRRPASWMHRRPLRTVSVIGGATFATVAGWLARQRPATADFSDLLGVWLIGVTSFLLAFVPPTGVKGAWPRAICWFRGHRIELAGMAALLLVALAARAVALEHIPSNLGGDEGTQGVAALKLLEPPLGNPFSTGWFSVPTMSFLAMGLSMRLFGGGVAGLRALSALVGTATVLTTALLARELWGRRVAGMAAAALTCSHFHVHFSRLGSNQIADGLFVTLTLYLLVRGLRSKREITFALAGAVTGLGWYGYFGARLVGIIVVLYLAWRAVVEYRFLARYGRLLLIMLGAALVVTAPLLFHYVDHPENLVSRSRQVSIFASGWLAREREITGRSTADLLLQQFWRSISAFHYTLDTTFWYRAAIPLLDPVSGVLFVLGLVWATAHHHSQRAIPMARCHWPANGLTLLWFWLALFAGWVLTENPPSSMRLVIVSPALAILVGLGLNWLMELGRRVLDRGRDQWDDVAVVVLSTVAFINLYYYFAVYTPSRVYGNPTAEVATELGRSLAQRDDGRTLQEGHSDGTRTVYFHAPPFMYWGFGTLSFLARDVTGIDVPPPERDEAPVPDLSRGARFVFLPERLSELEAVRGQAPGGVETPVYSSADGRLLYVTYEVPAETGP